MTKMQLKIKENKNKNLCNKNASFSQNSLEHLNIGRNTLKFNENTHILVQKREKDL